MRKLFIWLVGISLVLYLPSWFNGFVWDDEEQIVNNPFVKSFRYVGQVFSGSTFGGGGAALPTGGYYKPLMSVWYMVNYALFRDWAGGFHLSQSLVHGINAGLLYLIIGRFEGERAVRAVRRGAGGSMVAFLAALVWLVHPGNVESVAYAASAQEVLASFFGLLAWWVMMERKRLIKDEIGGLFVAAGLILPALLSKEAGIVFPLVMVAYLVLVERNWRQAKYFGLLILPVIMIYLVLRFGVAKIEVKPNPIIPVAQLSFGEQMLTVPETLWQHIRVTFLPVNLYIGHHQVVKNWSFRTVWQLVVILGLLGSMACMNWKQKSVVGWLFWVWLLMATGIVSNLYPLDMTYAERWSYMPMAAMMGWIGSGRFVGERAVRGVSKGSLASGRFVGERAVRWRAGGSGGSIGSGGFGRFGIGVILVLLVGRNVARQWDWHDGLRLYGHDIAYAQNSFDLENNYGVELMRAGRMEEAKVHFEKSMSLSPKWWTPPNNLGVVYQRQGDELKAIELYKLSIANGDYFLAYQNLAAILAKRQDPEAEKVIEAGLLRFPNNGELRQLGEMVGE